MPALANQRSIVVGIDGSPAAISAARWAGDLAARQHESLALVCVVPDLGYRRSPSAVAETGMLAQLRATAEHKVAEAVSVVREDRPKLEIVATVAEGVPAQRLIEHSAAARMVVVAANGVERTGMVLLGSTALRVANNAACPVAVWRGDLDRPLPNNRPVLVGVDGHPGGEAALGLAFELAALLRVNIIAVHAWYDPALWQWNAGSDALATLADAEELLLAERMTGWREKFPDVYTTRITYNSGPAQAMLEFAIRAQLLVTGNHGHNRVTGLLLDSTSQNLLHNAPCPTVICRDRR
ncbi:universal stress protein [Nocardia sp. NPDC046473]|uniref:universal stress protein n=1 Tax=Nocardia sp. NPDC046473 TaxID=3155733 RepID=UPI0033E7E1D2